MPKVSIKTQNKGGFRRPNKLKYGTQRLIKALIDKHFGPARLEKKTGIGAQMFVHWRNEGKVSLRQVGKVARILGESKSALNFEEYSCLQGYSENWIATVHSCSLGPTVERWVLDGIPPKSFEGD